MGERRLSLAALAAAGLLTAGAGPLEATTYNCNSQYCGQSSTCNGNVYDRDGCFIQCYNNCGGGEICETGSAYCSST
jgi:hypothetical protein